MKVMTTVVFALAAGSLLAQDSVDAQKKLAERMMAAPVVSFGGNMGEFIGGQMLSGKTVKGSPYSAQAVNETTQTLADGNHISRTTTSMTYRDSEGRERREESFGNSASQAKAVFISDPVEGVSYSLQPNSKVALKMPMPQAQFNAATQKRAAEKAALVAGPRVSTQSYSISSDTGSGAAFYFSTETAVSSDKQAPKTEHLGTQVMEGVSAEGTRTTVTIPAGQIGNEQPINIVSERWYSSDLQMNVMTKHSDPRMGETTYRLTNINRSEPSHTLFEVPADYTVKDSGAAIHILPPQKPDEQ